MTARKRQLIALGASLPGSQVSSTHAVVTPSIAVLSTTTANDAVFGMVIVFGAAIVILISNFIRGEK